MLKKRKPAEPVEEPEVVDEAEEEEGDEAEAAPPPKRKSNPIRLLLLLIIMLLACCAISFVLAQRLGLPIPGISSGPAPADTTPAPTTESQNPPAEGTPTEAETPVSAETPLAGQTETPATEPTSEGQLPAETTPAPETTSESPLPTEAANEATATATLVVPMEEATALPEQTAETPTEEAAPTSEPTNEPATTGDCSANQPPVAQATGPNEAMMGKGLAVAVFEAAGSTDPDGSITHYAWDFGDGDIDSGDNVTHGYAQLGSYAVTLTVTDNCGATAESKVNVTVTGPTPPAATPVATVAATPVPTSAPAPDGTLGFCHYVQPGQTLYGIAGYYGIGWADLAAVNEVSPEYMVRAGQGLFIPTTALSNGPNLYEVSPDETLYDIAYQCGLTPVALANANGLDTEDVLTPGQVITIPLWH